MARALSKTQISHTKKLISSSAKRKAQVRLIRRHDLGQSKEVKQYRLKNGLDLILLSDHSAPVLSYQTWFRVGSRHEKKGKTGLAHLFEHLMFNETKHLPAGQFDRILESAGGETNAATWLDWTFYYENLPSSKLELVASMEAERMVNLVLRKPQLDSEKEVVANERRYRVEDDIHGAVNEKLYATAFRKHPYHWPTIGWMEDILNFKLQDCREFYKTFYAPNNATIVISGDVSEEDALHCIEKHYGKLPSAKIPKEKAVKENTQRTERKLTMRLPTPTEKLQLGYRSPALADPDHTVLCIIDEMLFGGRSSRLHRSMVVEAEAASEVSSFVGSFKDPGLYEIWISMREGKSSKKGLALFEKEIRRFCHGPIRAEELDKAKNRFELSFLQGMENNSGRAEGLGFYATVLGDFTQAFSRMGQVRGISVADLRRVSKKYFNKTSRTTITVLPKE
ncbi:MAG: insulinase family protein [Myxococcales bacterium]|nr:MAG: insulinase family protein [Myxococcales bacterium]